MRKILKFIVFAILFPALILSTAVLTYLHFFASGDRNLSGQWTAKLDMGNQVAAAACGWLQEIEAVSISMQDIQADLQGLTVEINLTLEQTAHAKGTFQCAVLPESYDACSQAAYEAFAAAFRKLLAQRLHMAGYTGNTDTEAVEELIMEAFGMSTVSYLMTCGPKLLPSLEELQTQYGGSGTYQTAKGILTRQFEDGESVSTREEGYIRKGSTLILSEDFSSCPSVIYTLQQTKNQILFTNMPYLQERSFYESNLTENQFFYPVCNFSVLYPAFGN